MSLTPKNWTDFQHYKGRRPPWIKLHRALLDDYDFACLPDASRALAPLLWLLASEFDDGVIDVDFDQIAFRLHMPRQALAEALKPLVERGFFALDSGVLASRKQSAMPETERESEVEVEEESEKERLVAGSPAPAGRAPGARAKQKAASAAENEEGTSDGPVAPESVNVVHLPKADKSRGTRLPPDWRPSHDNWDAALGAGLTEVEAAQECNKFRDFWHAKAGKDGRKVDWDATLRNWMRKAAEQRGRKPRVDQGLRPPTPPSPPRRGPTDWTKRLREYGLTGNWRQEWGPAPGEAGCLVPPEFIREGV